LFAASRKYTRAIRDSGKIQGGKTIQLKQKNLYEIHDKKTFSVGARRRAFHVGMSTNITKQVLFKRIQQFHNWKRAVTHLWNFTTNLATSPS
jgi:hypothetical protein